MPMTGNGGGVTEEATHTACGVKWLRMWGDRRGVPHYGPFNRRVT